MEIDYKTIALDQSPSGQNFKYKLFASQEETADMVKSIHLTMFGIWMSNLTSHACVIELN